MTTRSLARALCVGILALPAVAAADVACAVDAFGRHVSFSSLVDAPVGLAECDTPIPIIISGLTLSSTERFIDVWRASPATATCHLATVRGGTAGSCAAVPLDPSIAGFVDESRVVLAVTPRALFGDCVSSHGTLFFFDTASSPDDSTTFAAAEFCAIEAVLDALAPSAPTVNGDVAGDASVIVPFINPADIGVQGEVSVYFDAAGCAIDADGSVGSDAGARVSEVLIAGAPPSATHVVFIQPSGGVALASVTLPTANLWSRAVDGARGAIAITVSDSALNESVLSNVVCVTHVSVTASSPSCGGCSAASGPPSCGAILAVVAAGGVLRRRRRRCGPTSTSVGSSAGSGRQAP